MSLSDLERQVRDRLKELEPLVREAGQLRYVLRAIEDAGAPVPAPGGRRSRRRGRPKGSATGSRAADALRLVSQQPGITVGELADAMGIGTTYLYRVMPALVREGKVRKVGTGYETASRNSTRRDDGP